MTVAGPLHGFRVLDLSAVVSGPLTGALLADQGADVIKVERTGAGDIQRHVGSKRNGFSGFFHVLNRGKRSLAVDLATREGVDIVRRLAGDADVVIQNFRPGVVDRLGIAMPGTTVEVHYVPPVPMKEAIDYMLGADLLYASSPAYGSLNSPAKIYQYMRANRPILAIHEEGAETFRAEINDANISLACLRGAHATAAEFLTERALDENHSPPPIGPRITQYSRRELTGRFADFITTKVLEI